MPFLVDFPQQVHNLVLHRHIQGRCGLIGHDQPGMQDNGHGNHHPLAHPPAELMRITAIHPLRLPKPHCGKSLQNQLLHGLPLLLAAAEAQASLPGSLGTVIGETCPSLGGRPCARNTLPGIGRHTVQPQHFLHLPAHPLGGIQRSHGFLKHHGHTIPLISPIQCLIPGLSRLLQHHIVIQDSSAGHCGFLRYQPHQSQGGDGLTGTGFPHHPQNLPVGDLQAHMTHCLRPAKID